MSRSSRMAVGMVALLFAGCAQGRVETGAGSPGDGIEATRTVFLGTFGRTADGGVARDQMRAALEKEARFVVVETEAEADAVIRGEVVLRRAAAGRLLWRNEDEPRDVVPISNETVPAELIHRLVSQLSEDLHRVARGD